MVSDKGEFFEVSMEHCTFITSLRRTALTKEVVFHEGARGPQTR